MASSRFMPGLRGGHLAVAAAACLLLACQTQENRPPIPEPVTLLEGTRLTPSVDLSGISLKLVDVAEKAGINFRLVPPEAPPYSPISSTGA